MHQGMVKKGVKGYVLQLIGIESLEDLPGDDDLWHPGMARMGPE